MNLEKIERFLNADHEDRRIEKIAWGIKYDILGAVGRRCLTAVARDQGVEAAVSQFDVRFEVAEEQFTALQGIRSKIYEAWSSRDLPSERRQSLMKDWFDKGRELHYGFHSGTPITGDNWLNLQGINGVYLPSFRQQRPGVQILEVHISDLFGSFRHYLGNDFIYEKDSDYRDPIKKDTEESRFADQIYMQAYQSQQRIRALGQKYPESTFEEAFYDRTAECLDEVDFIAEATFSAAAGFVFHILPKIPSSFDRKSFDYSSIEGPMGEALRYYNSVMDDPLSFLK